MWKNWSDRTERLGGLVFGIGAHGPSRILESLELFRWCAKHDKRAFLEIALALQDVGMDRGSIQELVIAKHGRDCACWNCILRLNGEIVRLLARLRVDREWERLTEAAQLNDYAET